MKMCTKMDLRMMLACVIAACCLGYSDIDQSVTCRVEIKYQQPSITEPFHCPYSSSHTQNRCCRKITESRQNNLCNGGEPVCETRRSKHPVCTNCPVGHGGRHCSKPYTKTMKCENCILFHHPPDTSCKDVHEIEVGQYVRCKAEQFTCFCSLAEDEDVDDLQDCSNIMTEQNVAAGHQGQLPCNAYTIMVSPWFILLMEVVASVIKAS